MIDEKVMGKARATSKKKAEEIAAKRAYEKVGFILCGEFTIFERD